MADSRNELPDQEEDTQKGKFLTFLVGKEEYGIEIKYVTEIIGGMQTITEVPEVPAYVKGIINLRGKIIPVVDVNLRFNKEAREYDDRTCIIVIDIYDLSVGLIVDHVAEVVAIADEEIAPPPDARSGFRNNYIKGIGRTGQAVKLILDCQRMLSHEDYGHFNQIA